MNKVASEVRAYWEKVSPQFIFDPEVLEDCVNSLYESELAVLSKGSVAAKENGSDWEDYRFVMAKVFNRHNDVCGNSTVIEDGVAVISKRSCITELDISLDTLTNCNQSCIYHIEDVNKPALIGLTFEAIADVTAAIIQYDMEM